VHVIALLQSWKISEFYLISNGCFSRWFDRMKSPKQHRKFHQKVSGNIATLCFDVEFDDGVIQKLTVFASEAAKKETQSNILHDVTRNVAHVLHLHTLSAHKIVLPSFSYLTGFCLVSQKGREIVWHAASPSARYKCVVLVLY